MPEYRGTAKDFGAYLERTVGHFGYLIGTRGQRATQAQISARLASPAYRDYWANISIHASKWLTGNPDKEIDGKDAWIWLDCQGWLDGFWNGVDIGKPLPAQPKYPDTTTYTQYALAKQLGLPNGNISTLPANFPYPLAVGYTGHVGFFYKGKVYQAAGHKSGTIITDLNSTLHNKKWQYWYQIPYLDYTIGDDDMELKKGDRNDDVKAWQTSLIEAGFPMTSTDGSVTYGADGSFGGATERATKAFQKAVGLAQSGVVGFYTTLAMSSYLASRSVEQKTAITSLESNVASCNVLLANAKSNYDAVNNKLAQIRAIL